ncbi:serine hydrolase [Streptacidiphilus sp. MAP5-3]|uniref:serine hydrolase n=1 Tax=unclassified Streptacidiphilus TaxID=2643834 RepID=UPI0035178B8F
MITQPQSGRSGQPGKSGQPRQPGKSGKTTLWFCSAVGIVVLTTVVLAALLVRPASGPAAEASAVQAWRRTAHGSPAVPAPRTTVRTAPHTVRRVAVTTHRRAPSSDAASAGLALTQALGHVPGHLAVAALDLTDGATLLRGYTSHRFVTASICKVDILATLLLARQDDGHTGLASSQLALATRMIENSDNDAADALFRQAGGAWGLTEANTRFGLTDTSVDAPSWGLTRTTASDQLRLLREVFTSNSALDRSSRTLIQQLMGQVEPDQAWGVSAVPGTQAELKNGWLPRPDGSWVVNSIGGVTPATGHSLLIVVLTDDDPTEDAGIALTETVARDAATTLGGA